MYAKFSRDNNIRLVNKENVSISAYHFKYDLKDSKANFISGSRSQTKALTPSELMNGCRLGLDTHADVSCVGRHSRVLEVLEGQSCTVFPFNDSYAPMKEVQVVNAAFAVDATDGNSYVVKINQCLDFRSTMEHSLLCTNQSRANGLIINDIPPEYNVHHADDDFSIYCPVSEVNLELANKGPIPHLNVRFPTDHDLSNCMHLDLTSYVKEWDPYKGEISKLSTDLKIDYKFYSNFSEGFDQVLISSIVNSLRRDKGPGITPSNLSKLWGISPQDAELTFQATTHNSVRVGEGRMSRRFKTEAHQRQYRQLGGYLSEFYSDTFFSGVKSTRGNNCIQLFSNKGGYVRVYPLQSKSQAYTALQRFLHEVGVPKSMMTDGARELTEGEWKRLCLKHNVHVKRTKPHSPWQNPAEASGGYMKRNVSRLMRSTNTPLRLWDYCWQYFAELKSHTATRNIYLDGRTPHEGIFGFTPDISELVRFSWYQWIWYHEPTEKGTVKLGRWLGPSHDIGQGLAYHILTKKGSVVTRSTVAPLSKEEKDMESTDVNMKEFQQSVQNELGNYESPTHNDVNQPNDNDDLYNLLFPLIDNGEIIAENKSLAPDLDDMIIQDKIKDEQMFGLKVQVPTSSNEFLEGVVTSRKRDSNGNVLGKFNNNPILDSRIFTVKIGEDQYHDFAANVILENLYEQVDDEGKSHSILKGIIAHRKGDEALSAEESWFEDGNGIRKKRITTKGWTFQVEWIDGSTSWIPLSLIKESNPLDTAEYVVSRGLESEAAFAWWVPRVMRKKSHIIMQIRHRVPKKSLKFGISVPSSVEEAIKFDRENGNSLWRDAINKEVKNVQVAFKIVENDSDLPVGSKLIPYHIIFDVKMDLTRKA